MAATETPQAALPDPQELARTYAEVAQRSSKLLSEFIQRQVSKGIEPPEDEMGVAQAFFDMMAKLMSDPMRLANTQMNLLRDYFTLWQHSVQRLWGLTPEPVATPEKTDKRFKHEE